MSNWNDIHSIETTIKAFDAVIAETAKSLGILNQESPCYERLEESLAHNMATVRGLRRQHRTMENDRRDQDAADKKAGEA